MAGNPVTLGSRKKGTIARVSTDQDGWGIFKDVPPGEYKVILQSPSYETFEVRLDSFGTVKTSMAVHFDTSDYCRTVRITVHESRTYLRSNPLNCASVADSCKIIDSHLLRLRM